MFINHQIIILCRKNKCKYFGNTWNYEKYYNCRVRGPKIKLNQIQMIRNHHYQWLKTINLSSKNIKYSTIFCFEHAYYSFVIIPIAIFCPLIFCLKKWFMPLMILIVARILFFIHFQMVQIKFTCDYKFHQNVLTLFLH